MLARREGSRGAGTVRRRHGPWGAGPYARGVDPVLPAFDGACVAGIVPALFGRVDDSWIPEIARAADAVVLLVLDGLGWSAVQDHAPSMPALTAMEGDVDHDGGALDHRDRTHVDRNRLGARATRHRRLPDARRRRGAQRLALVGSNRGRVPEPYDVQRYAPFLGREVPVVTRTEFRDTGFTQAHLREPVRGWHTTVGLIEHCVRPSSRGEVRLRVLPRHRRGRPRVRIARRRVFAASSLSPTAVGELLDVLPAERALLVTSDHGQIHLERESWIEIPSCGALITAMAGDGRFRYLYAAQGGGAELLAAARELARDPRGAGRARELLDVGCSAPTPPARVPGPHRQRRARGACAGRLRRPRAAERAQRCGRATAASRPTRCTCRCWPPGPPLYGHRSSPGRLVA